MIFKNIKVVHMLFVQLLSKFKLKVLTGSDSTEKTTTDLSVLLLCGCASYAQYENENKIGIELFHWSWVRHVFFFSPFATSTKELPLILRISLEV